MLYLIDHWPSEMLFGKGVPWSRSLGTLFSFLHHGHPKGPQQRKVSEQASRKSPVQLCSTQHSSTCLRMEPTCFFEKPFNISQDGCFSEHALQLLPQSLAPDMTINGLCNLNLSPEPPHPSSQAGIPMASIHPLTFLPGTPASALVSVRGLEVGTP